MAEQTHRYILYNKQNERNFILFTSDLSAYCAHNIFFSSFVAL